MQLVSTHASQPWEGGRGTHLCGPQQRQSSERGACAVRASCCLPEREHRQHVAVPPVWDRALELSDTDLAQRVEPSCGARAAPAAHQASCLQSVTMKKHQKEPASRAVPETKLAHPDVCLKMLDFYFPRDCSQSCS